MRVTNIKIAVLIFALSFAFVSDASAQPTKSPLISIPVSSFLEFPTVVQTIYVAGAIDALTFMSYNYVQSDHDKYVECFRKKSLGDFTADVVELAREQPENFDQNVATIVAMMAGRLCR